MPDENGNGVRISNRQIYEETQRLREQLTSLRITVYGALTGIVGALVYFLTKGHA
jgi:hypothetical protein